MSPAYCTPGKETVSCLLAASLAFSTAGIARAGMRWGRTRLHYEASRTIAFWVPAVIGPGIIKRTMREYLESSVAAPEQIANQAAGSRH
ncbi:MAG: hypothetical protein ACYC7B_07090 [Burkholderiales bacterium]